jgi:hypothetical protein
VFLFLVLKGVKLTPYLELWVLQNIYLYVVFRLAIEEMKVIYIIIEKLWNIVFQKFSRFTFCPQQQIYVLMSWL